MAQKKSKTKNTLKSVTAKSAKRSDNIEAIKFALQTNTADRCYPRMLMNELKAALDALFELFNATDALSYWAAVFITALRRCVHDVHRGYMSWDGGSNPTPEYIESLFSIYSDDLVAVIAEAMALADREYWHAPLHGDCERRNVVTVCLMHTLLAHGLLDVSKLRIGLPEDYPACV